MKKLAIVIPTLGNGGAEKVASILSYEFSKSYDVTIIIFEKESWHYPHIGKIVNINIPEIQGHIIFKIWKEIKRIYQLKKIFNKNKYDQVISFMESANLSTTIAYKNAVLSIHSNPNKFSKNVWREVRYFYGRANKVISVSKKGAEILRKGTRLKNIVTVNNPFEFKKIEKLSLESIEIKGDFIIAVGRLIPLKRFDLLINAYAESVARKYCKLIILGEGELRNKLNQQIKTLNLTEKVFLLGQKNNPYKYMAKAKFFILNSQTEGFPMALVEALGLGIPAIATDCETGPNEIIQENKNGILIPVNNNKEILISTINDLYFNKKRYQALKSNTKQSVAHLDVQHIAKQWLAK